MARGEIFVPFYFLLTFVVSTLLVFVGSLLYFYIVEINLL